MTHLYKDYFENAERRAHDQRNDKKANLADALTPNATGYGKDLRHHSEVEALSFPKTNRSKKSTGSSPSPHHALTPAATELTPDASGRWGAPNEPKVCQTLEGHSDWVTAVAFSPDSKMLVSASSDKTVRLWDSVTGATRRILEGHLNYVSAVAFSPDGKILASVSGDKTVRLWNSATGAARYTLKGHSGYVNVVAFSPDGKILASAGGDKSIRLWDSATGAARRTLKGHSGSVNAVAFSSDGKILASAGDRTVRLWDSVTGAARRILEGHSGPVNAVAFSPDNKMLASVSGDKTVRLWAAFSTDQTDQIWTMDLI
jgi:WD40 repeat protein